MPNVARILISVTFGLLGGIAVSSKVAAQEPNLEQLKAFIPAQDQLPTSVKPLIFPEEVKQELNFEIPGVTTVPKTIQILTSEFFLEPEEGSLEAMVVANYQQGEKDLGMLGWQLKSSDAAEKLDAQITEKFKEFPDRLKHYRKGKYVIIVWRDPAISAETFQSLVSHVEKTVQSVKE